MCMAFSALALHLSLPLPLGLAAAALQTPSDFTLCSITRNKPLELYTKLLPRLCAHATHSAILSSAHTAAAADSMTRLPLLLLATAAMLLAALPGTRADDHTHEVSN